MTLDLVTVEASFDDGPKVLTLCVRSKLSELRRWALVSGELDRLRHKYLGELPLDLISIEGGSGFPKLSRLARAVPKEVNDKPFNFGVSEHGWWTTVSFPLYEREGVYDDLDGTTKRVACAHLSQMGPIASAHAAATLLSEYRPRLLVMTGICGGFSKEVSIGDLVIADKSWDWQAGKWTEEGMLAPSVDPRDGAADLVAYARTIGESVKVAHGRFTGYERPSNAPKLVAGPMVTGSAVVASKDIQEVFKGQHRKMAGIDMECYGMYYAASNHAGAPVRTLCIKAVSDLADRAKADDHQQYCSYISAVAMLEVVRLHFRNQRT